VSGPARPAVQLGIADIERAAERIGGAVRHTPTLTSRTADDVTQAQLFFKCENFQRTGSFKFRGAYHAIAALAGQTRKRGILAYSSGNHAQAVALAAQMQDASATIIMPHDAPVMKVEATKAYGARVVRYDRYRESREEIGERMARDEGLVLIPPYDHADIIAGQGTAARELFADVGELDLLLVCLGGGGLLAGSALAASALSPGCRVIGIEPEAGNDAQQSLRAGKIVRIPAPYYIADGALTTHLGSLNFPIIQALVADIVTVSDAALVKTMAFFAERMKIIVEPTGCLAAAAVLAAALPCRGQRVGIVVSGGNVDLATFTRLIGGPAPIN
jgi:threonine dehydratase